MITKVAQGLLNLRDQRKRRRLILIYLVVLVLLFLANNYFNRLSSPLKLIPQMFTAVAMGYVLLDIVALRKFKYVAEFIDWEKVKNVAESGFPPKAALPATNDK